MSSITDPTLLVVTLLRHVALAAGCYLVVVTVAGVLARRVRVHGVIRAVDRFTLPALRRVLDTSLGASLVAGTVVAPAAWAEPPPTAEHPPPTMVRLPHADDPPRPLAPPDDPPPDDPPPTTTSSSTTTEPPVTTTAVPTTTSTVPTPTTSTTTTSPSTTMPLPHARPSPAPAPVRDAPPGPAWTVQQGDHLWSIAERVLTAAWQRAPTDAETDPYWRTLVEANRDRLADRDNPDLLFAGQVLVVPTPAPP